MGSDSAPDRVLAIKRRFAGCAGGGEASGGRTVNHLSGLELWLQLQGSLRDYDSWSAARTHRSPVGRRRERPRCLPADEQRWTPERGLRSRLWRRTHLVETSHVGRPRAPSLRRSTWPRATPPRASRSPHRAHSGCVPSSRAGTARAPPRRRRLQCRKVTPPGSARATVTGGTVTGGEDYLLVSLPPGFVGVLSLFVSCASENSPRKEVRV